MQGLKQFSVVMFFVGMLILMQVASSTNEEAPQYIAFPGATRPLSYAGIFLYDPDTSDVVKLETGNVRDYTMHWSPNFEDIYYFTDLTYPYWWTGLIERVNVATNEITPLITLDQFILQSIYVFRDNRSLLVPDLNNGLRLIDLETGNQTLLANLSSIVSLSVSPDEGYVVFDRGIWGDRDIYLYDLQSHELRNLTPSSTDNYYPMWSSEGNAITFVSNRAKGHDLYSLNLDDGVLTQLTYTNQSVINFRFLVLDNEYVLYEGITDLYTHNFYLLHLETGNNELLFSKTHVLGSDVSPDGTQLVFSFTESGLHRADETQSYIVDLITREFTFVDMQNYFSPPRWGHFR